jgi:hypothetical protein
MSASRYFSLIPWKELQALMDELAEEGLSDRQVRHEVIKPLDQLIPAHLLPPPWGTVAEMLDGPALRAAFDFVLKLSQHKETRQQRRAERKARKQASKAE